MVGDDRVSGGGQVQQILLAGHVAPAGQRVVDADATGQGLLLEGVVLLLVVQHGPAVADHDHIEGVHQRGGIQRVAQGDVEAVAQSGGQEDVLVAVASPPGLVGEVGHKQDSAVLGHRASPFDLGNDIRGELRSTNSRHVKT